MIKPNILSTDYPTNKTCPMNKLFDVLDTRIAVSMGRSYYWYEKLCSQEL